MKKKTE